MTSLRLLALLGSAVCLGGVALPRAAGAQALYSLNTTCSIQRMAPVPCVVEAVDVGDATEYRHRVGNRTLVYRVFDEPYVRIEALNPTSNTWGPVRNATIRFSSNELCFNDRAFCVVNPNYLNSVREEGGPALAGRDRMGLSFGSNGRTEIACFDDGCTRLLEAISQ
jgi:hypothetical protein